MESEQEITIAALSTPEGKSGVAVIRTSGSQCSVILKKVCALRKITPRTVKLTNFYDQKLKVIDRGLILFFKSPLSFTGEDMLEFHIHGSPIVTKKIMKILLSIKNVRSAFPGEFSKRAFLNKKIGLSNLEGINNLIHADTDTELQVASLQAFGGLKKKFDEWKKLFIEISSLIESHIEFSEDDPEIVQKDIKSKIKVLKNLIEVSIVSSKVFNEIKSGIPLVIFGPPNTGKSSLFNLINNNDRSIVSSVRGTTRDIISSTNDFNGLKVNLIDSAGLHKTQDTLEKIGTQKAKEIIMDSSLLILVLSPDKQTDESLRLISQIIKDSKKKIVVFYNKSDKKEGMKQKNLWTKKLPNLKKIPYLEISCKKEIQNKEKYQNILDFIYINLLKKKTDRITYNPFTEIRHQECLKKSKNHLIYALENIDSLEIVAEEVRQSKIEFEKIIGNIDNEEQLDFIFKTFCIGK